MSNDGILCPRCGPTTWDVKDTRHQQDCIVRRRKCRRCGIKATTFERLDHVDSKKQDQVARLKRTIRAIRELTDWV